MSTVHDHFAPLIPDLIPTPIPNLAPGFMLGATPGVWMADGVILSREEAERIKGVIADFREACAAAAVVDKLTAQPDCVDPEKAKLEARVAELEAQLAAIRSVIQSP